VWRYLDMDEIQTLVCGGLADFGMTVTEVCNTDTGGKVEESSAILELSPRSPATNHDRITSDPPESLRNVLGTDILQIGRSCSRHEPSRSVEEFGTLGEMGAVFTRVS